MPKYIDADALIRQICGEECGCELLDCGYDNEWCEEVRRIANRPTVAPDDVRGVGEWISNHDGSWNCSECGLRVLIYAKGNFCPNCGARMKGVDGNGTTDNS